MTFVVVSSEGGVGGAYQETALGACDCFYRIKRTKLAVSNNNERNTNEKKVERRQMVVGERFGLSAYGGEAKGGDWVEGNKSGSDVVRGELCAQQLYQFQFDRCVFGDGIC